MNKWIAGLLIAVSFVLFAVACATTAFWYGISLAAVAGLVWSIGTGAFESRLWVCIVMQLICFGVIAVLI